MTRCEARGCIALSVLQDSSVISATLGSRLLPVTGILALGLSQILPCLSSDGVFSLSGLSVSVLILSPLGELHNLSRAGHPIRWRRIDPSSKDWSYVKTRKRVLDAKMQAGSRYRIACVFTLYFLQGATCALICKRAWEARISLAATLFSGNPLNLSSNLL